MSNQVTPLFWVSKIRPTFELMTTSALSTGLTAKLAPAPNGHWGSGVGRAAGLLEEAEGTADVAAAGLTGGCEPGAAQARADVLEKVGVVAAVGGPEELIGSAQALLVGGDTGRVAGGAEPGDVAVREDIGVGDRTAVILRAAVEQSAGDLGGGG